MIVATSDRGLAGGFIAAESFQALFLLDAATFVAYAAPWEPIPDDGLPRYPERVPPS